MEMRKKKEARNKNWNGNEYGRKKKQQRRSDWIQEIFNKLDEIK